jgi:hypothetical protein
MTTFVDLTRNVLADMFDESDSDEVYHTPGKRSPFTTVRLLSQNKTADSGKTRPHKVEKTVEKEEVKEEVKEEAAADAAADEEEHEEEDEEDGGAVFFISPHVLCLHSRMVVVLVQQAPVESHTLYLPVDFVYIQRFFTRLLLGDPLVTSETTLEEALQLLYIPVYLDCPKLVTRMILMIDHDLDQESVMVNTSLLQKLPLYLYDKHNKQCQVLYQRLLQKHIQNVDERRFTPCYDQVSESLVRDLLNVRSGVHNVVTQDALAEYVLAKDSVGNWLLAKVLQHKAGDCKVTYPGWSSRWDEWRTPSQIRPLYEADQGYWCFNCTGYHQKKEYMEDQIKTATMKGASRRASLRQWL